MLDSLAVYWIWNNQITALEEGSHNFYIDLLSSFWWKAWRLPQWCAILQSLMLSWWNSQQSDGIASGKGKSCAPMIRRLIGYNKEERADNCSFWVTVVMHQGSDSGFGSWRCTLLTGDWRMKIGENRGIGNCQYVTVGGWLGPCATAATILFFCCPSLHLAINYGWLKAATYHHSRLIMHFGRLD